ERIHSQVIALCYVFFSARSGEDNYGDFFEQRISLYLFQRLSTILLGHVEIKQNDAGQRRSIASDVSTAMPEIIQKLLAIFHKLDFTGGARLFPGITRQHAIVGVVFSHQHSYPPGLSAHTLSSPFSSPEIENQLSR